MCSCGGELTECLNCGDDWCPECETGCYCEGDDPFDFGGSDLAYEGYYAGEGWC